MIIESNDCNVPEFLDESLFIHTLSNVLGSNNGRVTKLEFSKGSKSGDNYLSDIYRIAVTYSLDDSSPPKQVFLIAKCVLQPEGKLKNSLDLLNVFEKEKHIYSSILPQLESHFDGMKLAPKCYYASGDPAPIFIFEDMRARGFQMADRLSGINENHCKLALDKLGQYHAASILLLKKDPLIRYEKNLRHGIFSSFTMKSVGFRKLFKANMETLTEHLSELSDFDKIVMKLKNIDLNNFFERVAQVLRFSPEDVNVITHGDAWINNFLFKYGGDENDPEDMVFIDYQGSAIGSLGLDLNYFFATSPMPSVLIQQEINLIENSYYPAFKNLLERYNYENIPSLEHIKQQIRKKYIFRFFNSFVILPMITLAKEDTANISLENLRNQSIDRKVFATKRFLETMEIMIKEFDSNGLLD